MNEQEIKTNEFKGIRCVASKGIIRIEPIKSKLDIVIAGNNPSTNPTAEFAYLVAYPNGFKERYPDINIGDILMLEPMDANHPLRPMNISNLFKGIDEETDKEIASGIRYAFFDMFTILAVNCQERHLK